MLSGYAGNLQPRLTDAESQLPRFCRHPNDAMRNKQEVNPSGQLDNSDNRIRSSRRKFLGRSAGVLVTAALARTAVGLGPHDIQETTKAQHDKSSADPGPENLPLKNESPNSFIPPTTDHGEVQTFWNSFSNAHRRIQEGGWSRQVTVEDFPISKDIVGVNMRLTAGGIRELHWHDAAEWAIMLDGTARITAIDNDGKSFVADIKKNDLWLFPTGTPHSIQGLAPDGCEFLLVFNDGKFSEGNTTLISDWTRHTPPEVLAKNWGVKQDSLQSVYEVPAEGKYNFQAEVPPSLEQDLRFADGAAGRSPVRFDFRMSEMLPTRKAAYGEVRTIDSRNFPVNTDLAGAHVIVKPGGLRELHWHQNANEWQYYIRGKGRMTVFFNGGKARTADFNAGDVGYVPRTLGRYIENVGDTDLVFLEMFKADRFMDLSLSEWVSNTPPELVIAHLGISEEVLGLIPKASR
jgi:oxalate decarboxylase